MPLILGTNSIKDTTYDVANSVKFNDGDSSYLTRANAGSDGTTDTWTMSMWVKRSTLGTNQFLFIAYTSGNLQVSLRFNTDDQLYFFQEDHPNHNGRLLMTTERVFRDTSAWYHIVVQYDSTQSTNTNRGKIFINGVQETAFDGSNTWPDQNFDSEMTSASTTIYIGRESGDSMYFDGYMAEVVLLDGTAATPTSFGEYDSNSPTIWKPKDVSGLSFGTHGFHLDFEKDGTSTAFVDSSSNARAITVTGGVDHSFTQAKFNNSSIYFDGTNDSLDIANSSDFDFGTGNFTFEFWVYKTATGKMAIFETRSSGDNEGFNLEFNSTGNGAFEWYDTSIASGNDLPRDPNAITLNTWTHYAVVRNGSTCTMYKNGTSVGTPKDVGSNSQNSAGTPTIGESAGGINDFQGYLDEIRLSSTARYTSNFTAPTSPFTSDSDTVLLIQSKASNLIGADVSGQGNHFTSINLAATDQMTDSPTNNFATWNPLVYTDLNFSEGNTIAVGTSDWGATASTIALPNAGKWYYEIQVSSTSVYGIMGFMPYEEEMKTGTPDGNGDFIGYQTNDTFYNGGGYEENKFSHSSSANDIYMFAADVTDNTAVDFYIGVNGTWFGSGDPANGSNPAVNNFNCSTKTWAAGVWFYNLNALTNFGNPPFTIASGNADANGYGNFEYAVPSGFYSLCTKNLAEFGG
tara:strand:- start:1352 stop:3409 length:2058 start_codon:yes stop_codon:yes gene_type:complete